MANILLIETSTRVCSVGIASGGQLLALREEHSSNYSHSALLTMFIEASLDQAGLTAKNLDAVGVSMGPGSYTGLRIGVSAAKGICYALDVPLIAIDTLRAMACGCLYQKADELALINSNKPSMLLCPMIDARRMEVYHAVFDPQLNNIEPTLARVISVGTFSALLKKHHMVFFGDGAEKCKEILKHENATVYFDVFPSARGLTPLAFEKFSAGQFADVAYFEPFYLKDFIAGSPKVKGLNI